MTVTEPPAPAFGQAFCHIGNSGAVFPHCVCGSCQASDDYSYTELALDACVTHMRDMVSIIESSTATPEHLGVPARVV
jgi:hypothetical protein